MGSRVGSSRSEAGVVGGWLQPFFSPINFYLDWLMVSHCCLLTSLSRNKRTEMTFKEDFNTLVFQPERWS